MTIFQIEHCREISNEFVTLVVKLPRLNELKYDIVDYFFQPTLIENNFFIQTNRKECLQQIWSI